MAKFSTKVEKKRRLPLYQLLLNLELISIEVKIVSLSHDFMINKGWERDICIHMYL